MLARTYNETVINQAPDGYINLTEMAQATGKRLDNWLTSTTIKELLIEFDKQNSNSLNLRELKTQAVITKRGRHDSGTWAHPLIAIQFAQHCSPIFALSVSQWVMDWMTGKSTQKRKIQISLKSSDQIGTHEYKRNHEHNSRRNCDH